MKKIFLTARDIDEHADRGVKELPVDDQVVLTDMAREQARARGVKLVRSQNAAAQIEACHTIKSDDSDLYQKIKAGVIANLGGAAPENLDAIIAKILNDLS